jgi:hypothetical protein
MKLELNPVATCFAAAMMAGGAFALRLQCSMSNSNQRDGRDRQSHKAQRKLCQPSYDFGMKVLGTIHANQLQTLDLADPFAWVLQSQLQSWRPTEK